MPQPILELGPPIARPAAHACNLKPLFALVDCNNFYVSCERLFQLALRFKAVVVLSNNDGCVIARSNEAKALGIAMGDPWHLRRKEFEKWGVIVRSSNYTLYGDISSRVMRTLANFSPELEVYSIDEAFLNLAGFADPVSHSQIMRATVLQWTGIPVSVGIAPTKTLAKVANRLSKKDPASGGVLMLADEVAQTAALAKIDLTDVWGIANRMAVRLNEIGINTPLELRDADPRKVRAGFGVVMERMVYELRGVSCLSLEEHSPDRKNIMASRSFGRPVEDLAEMREAVAAYVSRAAEKMRRQGLVTAAITVFVNTNRFRVEDAQYYGTQTVRLPIATSDTAKLIRAADQGLKRIWRPGFSYKKAGVMCLDLHRAEALQNSLFHQADDPGRVELMRLMDQLNTRFGRGTMHFAATGTQKDWKLRSEYLSSRYTTNIKELLRV